MDNITIARLLDETAALLEIDAADPCRIRSYRRAAEAVEQQTTQLATLVAEPKQLLAIAGIGKGMAANIVDLVATGPMPLREELLTKYKPTLLELVRLPPRASYGAVLQYFTGSKMHNVALRQRAIKRGLTLSEYALLRLEDNNIVAAATEAEIYNALDLDYIPPELRENSGELEAAASHALPHLVTIEDIRGDLYMHTDATDGRDTIRQMAEAALARGLAYIAITDHSKNLAMTNGLDDTRALAHIKRIREVDAELTNKYEGRIRVLPGIEVDILADGTLDLEDSTLAQMDIVIASVHGHFNQTIEEMTTRVLRALENPHTRILGHPTGRKVLSREPYAIHIGQILKRAAELGVAVEHNASPARADLNDLHLRLAKEHGCKIVINTDAHATEELDQMRHGITQLRRAWLTKEDLLNTQPTAEALLSHLRPKP